MAQTSSKGRPYARQDGYITILKERDWLKRYDLRRNLVGDFEWLDENGAVLPDAPVIVWKDVYVSGLDWGRKPKTVKYPPVGHSGDRNEVIGFEPSLSFKCALISKELFKLQKFRTKYRVVLELRDDRTTPVYDSYEFKGCVTDDWKSSGDSLIEQNVSLSVEVLPDDGLDIVTE